jgi:hypothetical protein
VLIPEPVRVIVCGLPGASSVIVTVALLLPSAAGVKVTLMVQLAFAASVDPQVFVSEKSAAFVPITLMELIFSVL